MSGWGQRVCINQCNTKNYNIEVVQVRTLISAYSPHEINYIYISLQSIAFLGEARNGRSSFSSNEIPCCVHVILLLLISGATARGGRPSPPSLGGSCLSQEQPPQSGCYQEALFFYEEQVVRLFCGRCLGNVWI